MTTPSGYTALDFVGYTDKGTYSASATYVKNDLVHYNNSIWRCILDDTTGITPAEGTNWTAFISTPSEAKNISYDSTSSGLSSANLQDAVDELNHKVTGISNINSKTADIYIHSGIIMKNYDPDITDSFSVSGIATLACARGFAILTFNGKVTATGDIDNNFNYGISTDIFDNAPNVTFTSGGFCRIENDTDEATNSSNKYAGMCDVESFNGSSIVRIGRVYAESGSFGAWGTSSFPVGTRFTGIVFGTYTG